MIDSIEFAKFILQKAKLKSITLNITQLEKLVYISDGLLLAYGYNIINENCCVWDYGPVYPKIYKWYSKNKENDIDFIISQDSQNELNSSGSEQIVDAVLEKFGKMSAVKLSEWSHQASSPWFNAKITKGMYSKIDKSEMKTFFSKFVNG